TLLQFGKPVVDIAVYTGDELPRRAVLPDRLINTLPGIFGKEKVAAEKKRLTNEGEPLHTIPDGVTSSANMTTPQDWIDPLHGYAYDSFNPDALMKAKVKNKKILLPGGASYSLLIIPDGVKNISDLLQNKIVQLKKEGAIIIGKYEKASFEEFGIAKDFSVTENNSIADSIAWNHRTNNSATDIYFVSNQKNTSRTIDVSLRKNGYLPELWDAVSNTIYSVRYWDIHKKRTDIRLKLEPNASVFIVFRKKTSLTQNPFIEGSKTMRSPTTLKGHWTVIFNSENGGPASSVSFDSLQDWSKNFDPQIKYYSGTAIYKKNFLLDTATIGRPLKLNIGEVNNIATIKVNGIDCGTVWTYPYQVDITKAVKMGKNDLTIEVTNTWANRLIGDHLLPEKERITSTVAPYRLEGKPLLKAGLIGPVKIIYGHDIERRFL
ncbi:MAG: glycosylhydrolase-like jelly roll fold domain-containing protein, partial [Ferruginibacter sp.]